VFSFVRCFYAVARVCVKVTAAFLVLVRGKRLI